MYLIHGVPTVPAAAATVIIRLGTNDSESEQVHRSFLAQVCEIHELGADKAPYMPSSAG